MITTVAKMTFRKEPIVAGGGTVERPEDRAPAGGLKPAPAFELEMNSGNKPSGCSYSFAYRLAGYAGLVALGLVACGLTAAKAQVSATASIPSYERHEVEGWSVLVRRELLDNEVEVTERALELLRKQLAEIVQVVPATAVRELQRVPLYFSPEYPGRKPTAEFHPDVDWLRTNGRDPAMARAIEFSNVRHFEAELDRMPNFVLHELAHAFHDRVLPEGFANPEIKVAYERAKASGKYDRVERRFGNGRPNTFERAYAMTDAMEYFAETSEAFFSRNDFFPFTRDELKTHDPEMFALLPRLWGLAARAKATLPGEHNSTGPLGAEIKPAADTPQPVTPQESLKRFKLAPGFRIELVASEPMLADPVAMAFDERGRLFVCEIYGYNLEGHYDVMELNKTGELDMQVRRILAPKEILERAERESHGSVKLLEDSDGDRQMDRMTAWATNLPPCYGLVAARQGVIVLCAPDIVYLADRDGDGRPEVRETLFTGFGVGEMWTRISNPQWGVDNWIYAANGGESAGTIRGPHLAQPVQLGNSCFRFRADGTAFEPISGGTGGFGLTLTDEDDRFLVSNQQHALYVAPLPHRYLARNPYYAGPHVVNNICAYGHPAKVFPNAPPDPWRLKRSQQPEWVKFYGAAETDMGLVTAACAPHIYRGDQFPPEYRGMHFSCECAYNLIHLCRLEPDGAGYKAVRAIENGEFLTSSEQWFRPVNLAGGPDGALYLVDMYREIIEDYSAIPRYLQQQYGLIAGWDRGRIWRVVYDPGGKADVPPRSLSKWDIGRLTSTTALTGELLSSNAWRRLTAQRLLVERGDRSVVPELQRLLDQSATPSVRLHALHSLAGLKALNPTALVATLDDASPGVRRHALQLSEEWLDRQPTLLNKVLGMTNDPDPKVRIQLAFTLGETRDARRLPALAALASQFGDDRWMQAAIVSSVPDAAEALLQELIKPPGLTDAGRPLAPALAGVIGARQQPSEIARLLQLVASYAGRGAESFQTACLTSLNESLKRGKPPVLTDPSGLNALRQLLASPSPTVRRLGLQLAGTLNLAQPPELISVFAQAAQAALNSELPLPDRQSAIALLASAPFAVLRKAATNLLAASQPLDIQLAAVNALSASDDTGVVAVLLSGWRTYSPKMQTAILDAMFKRQDRIKAFLLAIQESTIPRPGLDPLRQNLLRTNPDAEIRRLAEPILVRQAPGVDRQALLARYQTALSAPRHAAKGKELFQFHCSACHLLEGVGKSTGPELIAATKGRADETILLDILQPSDQITVGFRTYNVVTTSGHNLSGILAAETATSVTLPDEDGFPQTVLRKDIVSFLASEVSLMPANFDELLKPQDIADLLSYLRQLAGPPPGPVMTLFDEDPAFVEQLKEGDGTASIVTNQPHHGSAALRITPPQRFSPVIPGWQFRIVEKPGPGEYRYLRFAWKTPAGSGLMLELADQGQWPPPDKPLRRYVAGQNTTGWQARLQAGDPPRDWTEVVVDLWKDFGPFTFTGLAPTAMGGPAYFDKIELLREKSDSPVMFPKEGALPAKYPPDVKERSEPAEKDYYIFSSPCRSRAQIATIQKDMPPGQFTPPPADWKHLQQTRRILTEGGELRLLALGDSIVNDTMRSGWVTKLQEAYPKARIQATVYVRGGGGCQHYKEEGRVAKYILPRRPDLVFIGGISQRDIESIREVIRQLRAGLPDVEILLATGTFGDVDPRDPTALARASYSGTGDYGEALKAMAAEQRCAYLDMTTPWAEYLRSAKVHPHLFYRDPVHANEFGEQVLAKIMMSFLTANDH